MGVIYQKAKIRNIMDLDKAASGYITEDQVREIEVEFLVDTGATLVGLPIHIIKQLGLQEIDQREVVTDNGLVTRRIFTPVSLQVMNRNAEVAVLELMDETDPIMGYLSLEALDLCINPREGILEGNPRHGGRMLLML